jgi:hypothetical protein
MLQEHTSSRIQSAHPMWEWSVYASAFCSIESNYYTILLYFFGVVKFSAYSNAYLTDLVPFTCTSSYSCILQNDNIAIKGKGQN